MEADSQCEEQEYAQLLETDAAHVDVYSKHWKLRVVRNTCNRCARELHDKGKDVEEDEDKAETPCLDFEDGAGWSEVVYHPSHDHVSVRVCPDGCNLGNIVSLSVIWTMQRSHTIIRINQSE